MNKVEGLRPNTSIDLAALKKGVILRFIALLLLMMAFLFLPAGTLDYWQAWLWLVIVLLPAAWCVTTKLNSDPEMIERRLKMKEKQEPQKRIMKIATAVFMLAFLIPGFDKRFGWSSVPVPLMLFADVVVASGYVMFIRVMNENRFASRTIEVVPGQRVVTTGPYAIVRHPMYSAALLIYSFTPIALGSFWAFPAFLLIIPVLVARIMNEEEFLMKELEGYGAYTRTTRYRLIRGIW